MLKIKKIYTLIGVLCYTALLSAQMQTISIDRSLVERGNALVVFTRDAQGKEAMATVKLQKGRTRFSREDVQLSSVSSVHNIDTSCATEVALHDTNSNVSHQVILYFELDSQEQIFKVLVITGSLLDEHPFKVVEYSATGYESESSPFEDFADFDLDGFEDDEIAGTDMSDVSLASKASIAVAMLRHKAHTWWHSTRQRYFAE